MPPDVKRRPGGNRTAFNDQPSRAIDSTSIPPPSTTITIVEALDRVVAQLAAQRGELARIAGALDFMARSS